MIDKVRDIVDSLKELDDAVKVALDFAREDGNTLVLVFPDHDCGGFSIGLGGLGVVGAGIVEIFYQVLGRGTSYPLPAWAFAFFAFSSMARMSRVTSGSSQISR